MKKIMKQAGPAIVKNLAAAGGGVVSAKSNTIKSKLDFLQTAPGYVWPLIKVAVFSAVPLATKAIFKGKGKQLEPVIEAACLGANGVAGAELANATILKDNPASLAGIPTLGYSGDFRYSNSRNPMDSKSGTGVPTLGGTGSEGEEWDTTYAGGM